MIFELFFFILVSGLAASLMYMQCECGWAAGICFMAVDVSCSPAWTPAVTIIPMDP